MGKPAARLNDMHLCPMVTPGLPPIPHVGGPILGPGIPTVLIGGMPAAVMGDMCTCTGPPDSIILGSTGVMIGGKPAARMGDSCAHGGTILLGCPTVLIGEVSPGSGGGGGGSAGAAGNSSAMSQSSKKKLMQNGSAKFNTQFARADALLAATETGEETAHKHNEEDTKVKWQLLDGAGKAMAGNMYKVTYPDGKDFVGKTDGSGYTKEFIGYTKSELKLTF